MKRKRIKDYWVKKREAFDQLDAAKNRAGTLRINEYTAHVTVEKDATKGHYWVQYSVAKWYFEKIEQLGISL